MSSEGFFIGSYFQILLNYLNKKNVREKGWGESGVKNLKKVNSNFRLISQTKSN